MLEGKYAGHVGNFDVSLSFPFLPPVLFFYENFPASFCRRARV